jgi:hypothetical protein
MAVSVSQSPPPIITAVQVSGKVLLHVWCPTQPAPYPSTPPLIALTSSSIQPPLLLQLTHSLATAAVGLVGDPMVHELAVRLVEQLEELPQQQQWPPPFDRPLAHAGNGTSSAAAAAGVKKNGGEAESEGAESEDGYTEEAQQHAAAAEALLGGVRGGPPSDSSSSISSSSGPGGRASSVSSSSSRAPPRRRGGRMLSPQQQEAESRRLLDYFKALQVLSGCRGGDRERVRMVVVGVGVCVASFVGQGHHNNHYWQR